MLNVSCDEAILFRMLVAFFGEDRVVPHMSVMAVCGGELPELGDTSLSDQIEVSRNQSLVDWARQSKCLFTIVNYQNMPKMVIELLADFSKVVDVQELERQRFLRPLLKAAGVPYVTMTPEEFSEIANPASKFDIFAFLKSKFEYSESGQ